MTDTLTRRQAFMVLNGLPGMVTDEGDGLQTTALDIRDGKIAGIYIVRNPDKLHHLEGTLTWQ